MGQNLTLKNASKPIGTIQVKIIACPRHHFSSTAFGIDRAAALQRTPALATKKQLLNFWRRQVHFSFF